MKQSENLVINTTFGFFIFYMIYLNYNSLLNSQVDFCMSILAIAISIMLLLSKNTVVLDISHFLYCLIYLFTVGFMSENSYLLGLNIVMISVIIFTRYYFNGCLLNEKQKHEGYFSDLNDKVKKYLVFWNWDYLFPFVGLVSLGRFINLKGYKPNI